MVKIPDGFTEEQAIAKLRSVEAADFAQMEARPGGGGGGAIVWLGVAILAGACTAAMAVWLWRVLG